MKRFLAALGLVAIVPSVGFADAADEASPREHWSYQTPVRPAVPAVRDGAWVRNPIDAFIARKHEELELKPRPPAEKHTLLRRVYLDLIGIPPTRDELHAFLADMSIDAYEEVVDRLLSSPLCGERWGRHWMDIWRYSDWYGRRPNNEIRYSQRHIWRWRDWIIESLNEDKGYDRMIVEMIAGDEVAPTDENVLRATGFLGRNWYKFDHDAWLFETVEKTSKGLLALTMRCARCHDHKFAPISQMDYYRFRAFFEPHAFRTDRLSTSMGTEVDNGKDTVLKDGLSRVFDAEPDAPTYFLVRGDDRNPRKDRPLTPGVPASLGDPDLGIQAVSLPAECYIPELRVPEAEALIAAAASKVKSAEGELAKSRAKVATARQGGEAAELREVDTKALAPTLDELKRAQRIASNELALNRKKLRAARAELAAVKSRIDAERAKHAEPADPRGKELALAASRAERSVAVALAEEELLLAELALENSELQGEPREGKASAEGAEAARKKVETARQKLEAALTALEEPDGSYKPFEEKYPRTSTGRRSALARWLTDPSNPRAARVAVNHIWLRHFGHAVVEPVDDFGPRSKPRSHPELLDWLAIEFIENRWSMKHLHRLIVTSNTYRMKSSDGSRDNPNLAVDPENRYLWRMNSRRMEAEVVRDSLLAAAGELDCAMGGPDLDEKLGQTSGRRSLYFRTTPDNKMELLELFDLANPNECYRRRESIVPQQALAMTNSAVALNQSRLLARRLSGEVGKDDQANAAFITAAFEEVLSRSPSGEELAACNRFLERHTRLIENTKQRSAFSPGGREKLAAAAEPHLRARENLVHVLFSHNDFVTIR